MWKFSDSTKQIVFKDVDGQMISCLISAPHPDYTQWVEAGNEPSAADPIPAEELASAARSDRDGRITAVAWMYERHARELRLGLPPTDDLAALDTYVQVLADVPTQKGFPSAITWPVAV